MINLEKKLNDTKYLIDVIREMSHVDCSPISETDAYKFWDYIFSDATIPTRLNMTLSNNVEIPITLRNIKSIVLQHQIKCAKDLKAHLSNDSNILLNKVLDKLKSNDSKIIALSPEKQQEIKGEGNALLNRMLDKLKSNDSGIIELLPEQQQKITGGCKENFQRYLSFWDVILLRFNFGKA